MKLEKPEQFTGVPSKLQNFLFSVQLYCGVCGVTTSTEMVKVAVTLLAEKALTWWRSVSTEGWAQLGVCDWATFEARIGAEFKDSNHVLKMQTALHDLKQKASVSKYNDQFRTLMLEVRTVMSGQDLLLAYLRGLKPAVQTQVMLASPADV